MRAGLAKLSLSELPQDSVVLCGAEICPVSLGQYLASAGVGQVQVYHGGVEYFDFRGEAKSLSTPWDDDQQEEVGRSWVSGVGGSLVTHNLMFGGCEAGTAVYIARGAYEPGMRSGLLRGVGRLILIGDNIYYGKKKLQETFDVIEI